MGPLSVDLRERVVSAVREEGMSSRAAAKRFGVSFASAIRWVAALRERGSCAPLPMGGDQRSGRVEAHADYLLGLHRREPDLTLVEICERLKRVRGEEVSPSMIWRFFDRHDITYTKSRRMRANRTVPMSVSGAGNGSKANSTSIRESSSPSTKPGGRPIWRDFADVRPRANAFAPASLTDIGRRQSSSARCD